MTSQQSTRYQWPTVELGPPATGGALTVWPVMGSNGHRGDYTLLSTAIEKGSAKVTEVSEGAQVPVIEIENIGDVPLLGIQGEEFVGAKQNRTLNVSVLAAPGTTRIPVTCVEQGRWQAGMRRFGSGMHEYSALRRLKAEMTSRSRKTAGDAAVRFAADQSRVWSEVLRASAEHGVHSPTMAMNELYSSGKMKRTLNGIIEGVQLPGDSRGVVVALGGRMQGVDLFETEETFAVVWPGLLRSYAFGALGVEKSTPPPTEAAESFVAAPRGLTWSATPSVGLGEDVRWESKTHLATALVWEERFLHAALFARAGL
ncbi:MAG: hypothetical protein P8181_16020 [bacterium]